MRSDVAAETELKLAVPPQSVSATVNGTEIDCRGYEEVIFVFQIGAVGTATMTPKVQETDTTGSGYADVGGSTAAVLNASNTQRVIRLKAQQGRKRFMRVVGTYGGSGAILVGGHCILAGSKQKVPAIAPDVTV